MASKVHNRKPFLSSALNGGMPVRQSYACRGSKSQRTGGTKRRLGRRNHRVDYQVWTKPTFGLNPELENIPKFPISAHAKKLLVRYNEHILFLFLFCQSYPIDLAGEIAYRTGRRQTELNAKELKDTYDNDPLEWLRTMMLKGLARGEIARGRETLRCPVADLFFTELAGGRDGIDYLQERARGAVIGGAEGYGQYDIHPLGIEILEYTICRWLTPKASNKTIRRRA